MNLRLGMALMSLMICTYGQIEASSRGTFSPEDEVIIQQKWTDAIETPSGLRYVVQEEGEGHPPMKGVRLKVLYKGSLIDGTVFSSVSNEEKPFTFQLGRRQVIDGWEEAFREMRKGEKRILIIPHELGYGLKGKKPKIPRRATLIFEVTLLDF
jgi:peptidylprolyl isomerase